MIRGNSTYKPPTSAQMQAHKYSNRYPCLKNGLILLLRGIQDSRGLKDDSFLSNVSTGLEKTCWEGISLWASVPPEWVHNQVKDWKFISLQDLWPLISKAKPFSLFLKNVAIVSLPCVQDDGVFGPWFPRGKRGNVSPHTSSNPKQKCSLITLKKKSAYVLGKTLLMCYFLENKSILEQSLIKGTEWYLCF